MYKVIVIAFVKIVYFVFRLTGRKSGNYLGLLAKKLKADILKDFNISCPVIAVTATNGKTTTNNCISYIISSNEKKVICNYEGNNLETGIITSLIKKSTLTGKINADYISFEVDESYVPVVFSKMRLDTLVINNFFRDQLDRNGEVEILIQKIKRFLSSYTGNLILNRDDPNVVRLGSANPENKNVYYFSVDKYKYATTEELEAGEGKFCPYDKTRLKYKYYQYAHIGKFECPKCGYGNEELLVELTDVDVESGIFYIDGEKYTVLSNNIYTMYNLAAAFCVSKVYNFNAKDAIETFKLGNGRCEEIIVKGISTNINLAKNPTGANVSLRILNEDSEEKELLFVLNDNAPDGYDVSWIWDINFEVKNCKRIITSGKRAYDIAIRIKTSGYDVNCIEPYLNLNEAIEALYKTNTKKYVITNYTALQPTRKALKEFDIKKD